MGQGCQALLPQRWLRQIRTAIVPGLAVVGVIAFTPHDAVAQIGWKWGGKRSAPAHQAAPKTGSQNGFAAAIHKLQADAKQKAFEGDIDGAIACAQRARKIAEASSTLVAEDPSCSVVVADQLVQKLMAIRSASTVPAGPAPTTIAKRETPPVRTAEIKTASLAAWQRPAAPDVVPAASPMATRPFPSSQRPLTMFTPHPLAAWAERPPVVAGEWTLIDDDGAAFADDSPVDSIEDAGTTHRGAIAARSEPNFSWPATNLGAASLSNAGLSESATGPEVSPPAARGWRSKGSGVKTAVSLDDVPASADGDDQFQLLRQTEPPAPPAEPADAVEPAADEASQLPSLDSLLLQDMRPNDAEQVVIAFNNSVDVADAMAAVANTTVSEDTAQWRTVNAGEEPATTVLETVIESSVAHVTPTAYLASQSLPSPSAQPSPLRSPATTPTDDGVMSAPALVNPAWFREVESAIDPNAQRASSVPVQKHTLQFVERLAVWTKLPVQTVAAWMAGLGCILLGVGLCLMRIAVRPHA